MVTNHSAPVPLTERSQSTRVTADLLGFLVLTGWAGLGMLHMFGSPSQVRARPPGGSTPRGPLACGGHSPPTLPLYRWTSPRQVPGGGIPAGFFGRMGRAL